MKYQFNLEWDELPEDFREAKITEYIEAVEPYECYECDGAGTVGESNTEPVECENCKGKGQVSTDSGNLHEREEALESIRCHFPIYF